MNTRKPHIDAAEGERPHGLGSPVGDRAAEATAIAQDSHAAAASRHEAGTPLLPEHVLTLQASVGNRAVTDMLCAQQGSDGNATVQLLGPSHADGVPTVRPKLMVMRFDAGSGGHQGLEREVAGLDPKGGLGRPEHLGKPEARPGTREAGVNAIYAGNFMQDFSQLKVPNFHKILSSIPKNPVEVAQGGKSETVGAKGGEAIADALIQALAVLEVGPRLAKDVVRPNMQSYRPEQHVDQPMGYSAATDSLVRDSKSGELRPGRRAVEGWGRSIAVNTIDRDRDRDLKGSAVPGIQMENPELLKISDAGLQNHIYNSVEWVKDHWLKAARAGPTDQGRFHIGAGLHAIEDYFSHSNFIEVGLNSYIDRPSSRSAGVRKFLSTVQADESGHAIPSRQPALGKPKKTTHVDTMFDAPGGKGRRQAITSGSVGPNDLKASIGHILLPRIPALQHAIDQGIDKMFHLVQDDKASSWDQIKKTLRGDRPTMAIMTLGEGLDQAGMTLPVPTGVELEFGREIPLPFVDNIDIPTGIKMKPPSNQPITKAISAYKSFVKQVKDTIDHVKKILDWIRYLGPIIYAAVSAIKKLLNQLHALIKEQLEKLREEIKHHLNLFIVQVLDTISGVDVRDQKNRTIGDALHDVEDRVHDFERQTSLEARLLPGGDLWKLTKDEVEPVVGPVEPAPGGGWKASRPLPPSHSEIAKDHAPPEKDLHTHATGHDHTKGSIFYGLARGLAIEADRHVLHQVELMWADRGSLYGEGGRLDTGAMEIGHTVFTDEAKIRARAEEKRAGREKHRFAQADAENQALLARPAVRELLDLVDLIISHPDDSTWWRSVFDRYLDAHPDEVARHIRQRNMVRGARTRISH